MGTRKNRIANGLCGTCGKNAIVDKTECDSCTKTRSDREKERYKNYNAKRLKDRRDFRIANGLCSRCGEPSFGKSNCNSCLEKQYEYRKKIKDQVYNAYGGYKCNCCGETTEFFLTLDHINNDGAEHRKMINGNPKKRGGNNCSMYRWIIKNNYPPILQVLCFNCNCGKKINGGVCPHKTI